jgi:hypothetical protein
MSLVLGRSPLLHDQRPKTLHLDTHREEQEDARKMSQAGTHLVALIDTQGEERAQNQVRERQYKKGNREALHFFLRGFYPNAADSAWKTNDIAGLRHLFLTQKDPFVKRKRSFSKTRLYYFFRKTRQSTNTPPPTKPSEIHWAGVNPK